MEFREPTETELSELRERVRPYFSKERYAHTLSTEGEAAYMARILLPEREGSLRAAAILHDIAKKLSYENQLNYIRECDIVKDEINVPIKVAHAPAGAAMVMEHFPEFASPDIVSAVRYHTTGHEGMTLFEAIVFLADYIEPTRKYDSCRNLYRYIHESLADGGEKVFIQALIDCAAETLLHLHEPDTKTVRALDYFRSHKELPRTLS